MSDRIVDWALVGITCAAAVVEWVAERVWPAPKPRDATSTSDPAERPFTPSWLIVDQSESGLQETYIAATDTSPVPPEPPGDGPEGASAVPPATPPSGRLSFVGWATPAICDVLARHHPIRHSGNLDVLCSDGEFGCGAGPWVDRQAWRDHVAPLIADRLERAGAQRKPLQIETGHDMGCNHAAEMFPQFRKK